MDSLQLTSWVSLCKLSCYCVYMFKTHTHTHTRIKSRAASLKKQRWTSVLSEQGSVYTHISTTHKDNRKHTLTVLQPVWSVSWGSERVGVCFDSGESVFPVVLALAMATSVTVLNKQTVNGIPIVSVFCRRNATIYTNNNDRERRVHPLNM